MLHEHLLHLPGFVCTTAELVKPNTPHKPLPANAGDEAIARLDKVRNASGTLPAAQIRKDMQKVMQNNAAVFRTQDTLEEGVHLIDQTVDSFKDLKVSWSCTQLRVFGGFLTGCGQRGLHALLCI